MAPEITTPQVNKPASPPVATEPDKKSRNVVIIVIVVLVVLVVFVAIWFALKSLNTSTEPATTATPASPTESVPAVKSDADLKKFEDELNNTSIDGLQTDLNANDTDAAGF